MSTGIKRARDVANDDLPYGSDSDRSRRDRDYRRSDGGGQRDRWQPPLNDRRSRGGDGGRDQHRHSRDGGKSRPRSPPRGPSHLHRSHPDQRRSDNRRSGDQRGNDDDRRRSKPSTPIHESVVGPNDEEPEEGEISPRMSYLSVASPAPHSPAAAGKSSTEPGTETAHVSEPDIEDEELTADQIIAAQRARRQALLSKLLAEKNESEPTTPRTPSESGQTPQPAPLKMTFLSTEDRPTPRETSLQPSQNGGADTPAESSKDHFVLTKSEDPASEATTSANKIGSGNDEQISAADYDPHQDRREEEMRLQTLLDRRMVNSKMDIDDETIEEEVEEEPDVDLDDMFAAISDKPKKTRKVVRSKQVAAAAPTAVTAIDSAADPEGYYQIILGEGLDGGRYQVFSTLGKGMFSAVVRARIATGDPSELGREVAIKIIRSQESMHKAGLKEAAILNKLSAADPEDKKHVIRLERTFEHRGHLCLVFESLSMNLREIVKRFGKDVGLNLRAVRAYGQQLLLSLSLLKKCNIMHADIKPDNILVNENKTVLKLCDLGSAADVSDGDITPYLVSRFYRAPEIILGLPYDTALDIWSVGCTLYELYTGKILFPGRSNNHMLLLMMEVKGRFNTKMIKKAKFGDTHFDDNGAFLSVEVDKITGQHVTRNVFIQRATRDLRSRLVSSTAAKANDEESKLLMSFVDLLDKCLSLDPAKRLTARDALIHPFIRG